MARFTIEGLPTEIHLSIAEYCQNNDLINLCLTSKQMKEICLCVLYRHVDLRRLDGLDKGVHIRQECYRMWDATERQEEFVLTLLSHPEYGKHVRFLKGMLCLPSFDDFTSMHRVSNNAISEEQLWRAMQSLTNIRTVDVGSRNSFAYLIQAPTQQPPTGLFQSATSVRLAGHMQYGLAKAILDAINPATLKHLCLDMIQDRMIGMHQPKYQPPYWGAFGTIAGLLTTLTGRCTALQTLILRREGLREYNDGNDKEHDAAEEPSYIEWASFASSVKETLEKFTFEYSGESTYDMDLMNNGSSISSGPFRNMGEGFRRLILPALVSGNSWPCLTFVKLRGIRSSHPDFEDVDLSGELRKALGEKVKIVVRDDVSFPHCEPYG